MDTRSTSTRAPLRHTIYRRIATALALGMTLGCAALYAHGGGGTATTQLRAAAFKSPHPSSHPDLLLQHQSGERQALRVRADPSRHRLWVLTVSDVYVYDTRRVALIRRIPLPQWSVADFMCAPALALDRRGAAFVSNNVQPRLLEIDPDTLRAREHALRLVSAKKWDIGFGALAFGQDGSLFAVSALAGALFKIDLASGRAKEIAAAEPLLDACSE